MFLPDQGKYIANPKNPPRKQQQQQQKSRLDTKQTNQIKNLQARVDSLSAQLKQKSGAKKQPGPKKEKRNNRKLSNDMRVMECSRKFAAAVSNPWSPEADQCCVPVDTPGKTWKLPSFKTINVTVGVNGYAFVAFAATTNKTVNAVCYSTAAYTGTTIDLTLADTGVAETAFDTLPFTSTQMITDNSAQGRVVVAGIRIVYTGDPLHQSGTMYMIGDSNRQILTGATVDQISSQAIARMKPVSKVHQTITQANINATERLFTDELRYSTPLQNYPFASGYGTVGTDIPATMGILIACATTSAGQTFQVDLIEWCEYSGLLAAPSATTSHTDAEGYSKVKDILDEVPFVQKSTNAPAADIFNKLYTNVAHMYDKVSPVLESYAANTLNHYINAPSVTRRQDMIMYS
jgi:hypothetical protein